jgi:hypothetical protein
LNLEYLGAFVGYFGVVSYSRGLRDSTPVVRL